MVFITATIATGVAIAGSAVGTALGLGAITGGFAAFAVGLGANVLLGAALQALTPKPSLSGANRGYQVNSRGSALSHQIIYGEVRVGGAIVYDEATGTNNKYLHRIIAVSGHEINSFEDIYINDEIATIDGSGNVTSPSQYAGKIRINTHLGASDQVADADLVAESAKWTSAHRLRGIAYMYVRMEFDADAFPNGVPTFTATVKGKKVYNPATDTTAWSDNPALCLRDYLTSNYGLAEEVGNIDDDLVNTAVSVCNETNTDAGTTRYTCNGAFTTDLTPYDVINNLLTSMGGTLWYAQGKWRMKPAYWTAPVMDLDENDLRSGISVATRHSRRDNFNVVKGTFRGEESNWQPTDYPQVESAAFLQADNGQESVADVDLPFTDNSVEARRLARIVLEGNRQQLTVSASFGIELLGVQVGDNIRLTNSRFGWTNKEFEVVNWSFGLTEGLDLQVQLTLRETAESVFDEVDDGVVYERDNTNLLSPFEVPAVGLSVSDRLEEYLEKLTNFLDVTVTSGDPSQIDHVEVRFKKSSDTSWKSAGSGALGIFEIVDLEDGFYDISARAINSFGVKGQWKYRNNYQVSGLSQPPADVTNFTAEVNGSTIQLSWTPVPDLDLSYYLIRYGKNADTATWADSITYVDKVPRPSTTVSVPAKAGKYFIKAFDKTGSPSIDAASVVVTSANLAGYDFQTVVTEDPTFTGDRTNVVVQDGELRLGSVANFDSLTGLLDDLTGEWDALGVDYNVTSGSYSFANIVDLGSSRLATVEVDLTSVRFDNTAGLFDDLTGNLDSLPDLFDNLNASTSAADTNVIPLVSYTEDDPSGTPTWSEYQRIRVADIFARAFRFKVDLSSTSVGITPSLSELEASVSYNT